MKEFLWQHIVSMTAMGTVCFTAGCLVCSSKLKDARALAEINARVDREAAAYLDAMDARKPLLRKPSAEAHIVHLQRVAAAYVLMRWDRWANRGRLGHTGWENETPRHALVLASKPDNILPRPMWPADFLPFHARTVRLP